MFFIQFAERLCKKTQKIIFLKKVFDEVVGNQHNTPRKADMVTQMAT